jgi:hypothetical protein
LNDLQETQGYENEAQLGLSVTDLLYRLGFNAALATQVNFP